MRIKISDIKINPGRREAAPKCVLVQTARDLTPETKKIIREADCKITKGTALKISRLPPDQQTETVTILTATPSTPKKQKQRIWKLC